MNFKSIATLAAAIVASSAALAAEPAQKKCGAGTCGKKATSAKAASGADASCGKKDASCSKKDGAKADASCSKKEASCSKKDASCSKKDASCSKK
ncbi:MAG: hypothetical protein KAX73_05600 [Aquabacterium sp.]|jgi:hypothetical protein|nr:hypothetical protein [Aquabacterium sp.]